MSDDEQLPSRQGAGLGKRAGGGAFDIALLLPLLEGAQVADLRRVLHPLDDLQHGDEVDVVLLGDLVDELGQRPPLLFVFQERSLEVQAEGRLVGVVVAVEVVVQQGGQIVGVADVGASVDHGTTGQRLVALNVLTTVQLVDDHLPDAVALARAPSTVSFLEQEKDERKCQFTASLGMWLAAPTVALVGHAEVERVRPDGNAAQRRRHRGVVNEEVVGHHAVLVVAADGQQGGAHTDDRAVGDVGEALDDLTVARHLVLPQIVRALRPVLRRGVTARDAEGGDLVAASVQVLHGRIVGELMRHEEGSCTSQQQVKVCCHFWFPAERTHPWSGSRWGSGERRWRSRRRCRCFPCSRHRWRSASPSGERWPLPDRWGSGCRRWSRSIRAAGTGSGRNPERGSGHQPRLHEGENWFSQMNCLSTSFGHHLQHLDSSDLSAQSNFPSQKSALLRHSLLPHASWPSGQTGSFVFKLGLTLRGSAWNNKSCQRASWGLSQRTAWPFCATHCWWCRSCQPWSSSCRSAARDRRRDRPGTWWKPSGWHRWGRRDRNAPRHDSRPPSSNGRTLPSSGRRRALAPSPAVIGPRFLLIIKHRLVSVDFG